MKTEDAKVVNKLGIHARPAAQIVKTASLYDSTIDLEVEGSRVNAKSIMGVMTLAACRGSVISVSADGVDEEDAVAAIVELIRNGFGEE